jgi:hypothetical protein
VTLSRHWDGGGSGGAALMKIASTMVMLMMIDGRLTNETACKDQHEERVVLVRDCGTAQPSSWRHAVIGGGGA